MFKVLPWHHRGGKPELQEGLGLSSIVYLLRHGETDWNADGRLQGQTDIPLNDQGRAQAHAVSAAVATLDIAACYASDLSRAYETAQISLSRHPAQYIPIPHPALRERHFGVMNGKTHDEIEAHKKAHPDFYIDLDGTGRLFPRDGEDDHTWMARVHSCLIDLPKSHDRPVLLVCHGGIIRQMLRSFAPAVPMFQPGNCHLYRMSRQNDGWQFDQIWPE